MIFIVKRLYDRLIQYEAEQCNESNKALGPDACVQIPMRQHNGRPWPSHLGSAKWGSASPLGGKKKSTYLAWFFHELEKGNVDHLAQGPAYGRNEIEK